MISTLTAELHKTPTGPPVAELRGISKRFGSTQALSDISLAVLPGETHALLGRNGAGKSTAVSILTGLQKPDEGQVLFGGEVAPKDVTGWRDHVACLYQHSTLVPAMTVTENLFIDRFAAGPGPRRMSWKSMRREAVTVLDSWQIEVDPDASIEDLPFEQRQLVEIARALSQGSQFIIMDEPTAQLDGKQIDRLFTSIRRFQATGISFLYISHFLREVFEICDRATVMRDGRWIRTDAVGAISEDDLVRAMVGSADALDRTGRQSGFDPAAKSSVDISELAVEGLFAPLTMSIRPGEVAGIAGSVRSGATAVGEVLAGLRTPTAGRLRIDGTVVPKGRVDKAIKAGVGYVPQDRHARGIVGQLSVAENLTMTIPGKLGAMGLISTRQRDRKADELIERLEVKVGDRGDEVDGLSGGNQQKVVLGRAIASEPRLLVLDTPTAGVDIASTSTLFAAIDSAAREGLAVLIISNSISELRVCDTIQVMFDGELTHTFEAGFEESKMIAAIEGVEHA